VRTAGLGKLGSCPEILADLDLLTETEAEQDNKHFMLRSAPRPANSLLRVVGVALSPTVRQVALSKMRDASDLANLISNMEPMIFHLLLTHARVKINLFRPERL
jgi:hypothetical protein